MRERVRLALPLDVDDQRLADREGGRPEHPRQGQGRGRPGQRRDDDDEQRHRSCGQRRREQLDLLRRPSRTRRRAARPLFVIVVVIGSAPGWDPTPSSSWPGQHR